MEAFKAFLSDIDQREHQQRTEEILTWIHQQFPHLKPVIKWNQPMFTDHGTFIIAFSTAKKHLAVAPENPAIHTFSNAIKQAGYEHTKELIRIPWESPVNYALLQGIIEFNIKDKENTTTFWRK